MEYEGDGDSNCNWGTQNDIQRFDKEIGSVRNWEDRPKPSKPQHYWDQPEYRGES